MMGKKWALLAICGMAFWACSDDGASDPNPVVARVGEDEIRRSEVESAWNRIATPKRPERAAVLQALIDRRLLKIEAEKRQLSASPRLQQKLQQARDQRARQRLLKQQIEEQIVVSEEEVRALFDAQGMGQKRHVRGRHIMVRDQAEAERIHQALLDGADFAEMARQHSVEKQTAGKGGDLGYWDETLMIGAVAQQLFALEMGQFSPPFPGREGYYHLVLAEDERPIEYADLAKRLRNRFVERRRHDRQGAFYEELRRQYEVRVDSPTLLELIELARSSIHGVPGPEAEADLSGQLVAYRGGQVDVEQYLGWIAGLPPNHRPVATDTASIRVFAQRTVIDSLIIPLEARRAGFYEDDEAARYIENLQEQLLLGEMRWLEAEEPLVGEAALEAFYQKHIERFSEPELMLYEALLLHTEEEGAEAIRQLRRGADMWELSHNYPRFHDMLRHYGVYHAEMEAPPAAGDDPQAQVMETIRQSPVGTIGGPERVSIKRPKGEVWWGFLVFRTLKKLPAHAQTLDNPVVRGTVTKLVRAGKGTAIEERFEAFMEQLRQDYASQVETFPERLVGAG